jgi:8-oxo-dGTP pyrophosphatase MutT (NUDIX family)
MSLPVIYGHCLLFMIFAGSAFVWCAGWGLAAWCFSRLARRRSGTAVPAATRSYVLGFAFTQDLRLVVLIEKARPEFMRGLLNGVGGAVEPGEDPRKAMVREFLEETGLPTTDEEWQYFGTMVTERGEVRLYRCRWRTAEVPCPRRTTDETPHLCLVDFLAYRDVLPNVPALVHLALSSPHSPYSIHVVP